MLPPATANLPPDRRALQVTEPRRWTKATIATLQLAIAAVLELATLDWVAPTMVLTIRTWETRWILASTPIWVW